MIGKNKNNKSDSQEDISKISTTCPNPRKFPKNKPALIKELDNSLTRPRSKDVQEMESNKNPRIRVLNLQP